MATWDEIKQAMVNRVVQEGLVNPETGQPMPAMDSVLDAVADGIALQEAGPGFGKVKVGASTLEADAPGDTLELVAGANIALSADTAGDSVTIAVTGTVPTARDADTVDGKHASDLALLGHGHTGGADGNQIGTSGLQDGAVTDAKVGNRTADQAQTPTGSTGTLTQLFSWIANRLKAITGATNWFDAPAATLAAIWAKFNASTGHKHTGAADDAPKISFSDLAGTPSSFTPALHKSTHASGGSDALTPGDIGAVSKAGDTMTGKLTAPSYGSRDTRSTATAPGDYDAEMRLQFKYLSAIGLSGIASGTYCQLMGYRAWSDDSGGRAHELAFTDGGDIYYRSGTEAAGWGSWQKLWHAGNDGSGSGLDADLLDGQHSSAFAPASHVGATGSAHGTATTSVAGFMSAADKTKLDGIAAGAEVNQNAFSNVLVGGTTIAADAKTDTLELVAGTNIALTPDAANDKVTIAVTGTVASASNADTVDGYHAGNSSGQVAVSNGTVCTNLNADKLDGYDASAFVLNVGSTPSIQAGVDASKPAAGTAGRLYVATDTQIIYRDSGSAWVKVGVVKWDDIDGKPSSFAPSAHKSTHASGGSDALTAGDIGAVSKAGDTMTGDLAVTKNKPWLTLDSPSAGANDNEQAAGVSIGESGQFGAAALHLTYTGDGYGHIGMGAVATAVPAYEAMRLYYQDKVVRFFDTPTVNGGAIWHAGNALRAGFYAYLSASQSLPRSATTKIAFNAVLFDHAGAFDTSNSRFVAPQKGVYLFEVNVNTTYYGCNVPKWTLYLYKNGAEAVMLDRLYADAMYAGYCLSGSAILLLNAGDYVEVYVNWQENYANNTAEGGSTRSSFAGVMLYSV